MLARNYFTSSDNPFIVVVPASAVDAAVAAGENGEDWHPAYAYRVTHKDMTGGNRLYFIESRIGSRWVYLGTLNPGTGDVRMTQGSRVPASKPRVRILQRVLRAIWEGRGAAIEAAEWQVTEAGPNGELLSAAATTAAVTTTAPALLGPLALLSDTFTVAIGYGLKRPMLRLHFRDRRFKFYLSNRGTVCLKTGALTEPSETGCRDPIGDEEYAGCLLRGNFLVARNERTDPATGRTLRVERPLLPVEREFLDRLGADPVGFITECGKDMGRCCYCNNPLEDSRSKAVGYGKTCAHRWGLPWGNEKALEKAPSFARCYNDTAHGLLNAIRDGAGKETPAELETRWGIFGDWLTDNGLPRCSAPARTVVMPRND